MPGCQESVLESGTLQYLSEILPAAPAGPGSARAAGAGDVDPGWRRRRAAVSEQNVDAVYVRIPLVGTGAVVVDDDVERRIADDAALPILAPARVFESERVDDAIHEFPARSAVVFLA